jgi:hypothetical protein
MLKLASPKRKLASPKRKLASPKSKLASLQNQAVQPEFYSICNSFLLLTLLRLKENIEFVF